jgi:magnesium-protoporphyrin O-methyltransferase
MADRQFTATKAAKELQAYRTGRLGATTRLLRDGIVQTGWNHGTLLDIGGGVGALTFELLDRGLTRAVVADASAAYATAAREEAARRNRTSSVEVVHGDILLLPLGRASVVTLDRVVCCYPHYEPMLERAAQHAEHVVALSYPNDRWYVRVITWFENARRTRTSGFRTFVHPPDRMQRIVQRAGFELATRRSTFVWTIDVFVRAAGTGASPR